MVISENHISELKEAYESNKQSLREVRAAIREKGCCDNGLSDASESFEQGWNNALEFVFITLGID